ncbi:diguanylate cyclase [Leifsonia shinshuensis]|uniref:diguanylate cyclase n=1 Tax=Leifsonia shinshuensis TaxID=150026 RepID=UPI00285F0F42|nr:diguanylate cyclase [Leifsonia shinshuensis]MDR6972371.1 diguanylate cyclase (GGDEF)-like protein [Leifsonia shinshuensis]
MRPIAADDLPCAIVRLDAEGRIVEANDLFAEWTGLPVAELTGRPFKSVRQRFAGVGGRSEGMVRLAHRDGSYRPVIVGREDSGDGAVLVLVDAADRAERERELMRSQALQERTRNRLELIIDSSIAFSAATSEQELVDILATTVAKAYQAEQSAVFLRDECGGFLQASGDNPLHGMPGGETLVAQASGLRNVLAVSGAAAADEVTPVLGAAMRGAGVHAVLVAPIQHDDLLFGVFVAFFLHPRQFDSEAAPLADALAGQAAQAITTLRLQRQLEHAAMHDETTGLPNRRRLETQLLEYGRATPALVATLFIDLDGFKRVNDGLGHHVGDLLLREVGRRLQEVVRQEDLVARYGGDEFVVVCEVPEVAAAEDVADRIRLAIGLPFADLPEGFPISASIGMSIARTSDPGWNPDRLIREADHAMYSAKNAGGNRVVGSSID